MLFTQAKWLQSKAFVSALYNAKSDILHTLPNGHGDPFWAYPGANKHGFLLKQLRINKIKNNQLIDIPKPIHKPTCKPVNSDVQYGDNSEQAQVYTVRSGTEKFTNTEIVKILQNPNKCKLSYVTPIKPKAGEVYVLDWQGDQKKVKDYVAVQYMWVADSTKMHPISGINLVKNYFNICYDSGQVSSRKVPFSRDFQKTVSYLKDNPFLQLIEYIGDD